MKFFHRIQNSRWSHYINWFVLLAVIFNIALYIFHYSLKTFAEDNIPPKFIFNQEHYVVDEGVPFGIDYSVSDPDNLSNVLSASVVGDMPDGMKFEDYGGAGYVDWKPTYDQAGTYQVTFSSTDGIGTTTKTISITVNDSSNKIPFWWNPDQESTVKEGDEYSIHFDQCHDENYDPLEYYIANAPGGMTIDYDKQKISWTPNFSQSGDYLLNITCSDGQASADTSAKIKVLDRITSKGGPANVLVIINQNSDESKEVGLYYKQKRGIPDKNIFYANTSKELQITEAEYNAQIRDPLKNYLNSSGLKNNIQYIVTTYGVPYKIKSTRNDAGLGTIYSVDSYLCDPFELLTKAYNFFHPYSRQANTWTDFHYPGIDAEMNGTYLTTRLDGPSVKLAKGLVDKAIYAETYAGPSMDAKGYMYGQAYLFSPSDKPYLHNDLAIQKQCEYIEKAGYKCDKDNRYGGENILWYAGPGNDYRNIWSRWLPGGVLIPFQSYTGDNTIRDTSTDRKAAPNGIAADATALYGTVGEPLASNIPHSLAFYDYFLSGNPAYNIKHFNMAESMYMSVHAVNWKTFFIGDPLYVLPDKEKIDQSAPKISNLTYNFSGSNATISWTNQSSVSGDPEVTYGLVEYGLDQNYGQSVWDETSLISFGAKKKNYYSTHTINLENLDTSKEYFVKVSAVDPSYNTAVKEFKIKISNAPVKIQTEEEPSTPAITPEEIKTAIDQTEEAGQKTSSSEQTSLPEENPVGQPIVITLDDVRIMDAAKIDFEAKTCEGVVLSGTALPDSNIELKIESKPITVRLRADSAGKWTYILKEPLEEGEHQVSVIVTKDGKVYQTTPPKKFSILLNKNKAEAAYSQVDGSVFVYPAREKFLYQKLLTLNDWVKNEPRTVILLTNLSLLLGTLLAGLIGAVYNFKKEKRLGLNSPI